MSVMSSAVEVAVNSSERIVFLRAQVSARRSTSNHHTQRDTFRRPRACAATWVMELASQEAKACIGRSRVTRLGSPFKRATS